jgi:hypothetical protein
MAPIDVISAAELTKSGKQSTRDLISTLVPSANTSNSGAGASFAIKTVSLRGLSADQTLVLVNGKRRHNTAILFVNGTTQNGQSPPDLDLIPSAAIERIEVLRDGASAQYGSDALAGRHQRHPEEEPRGRLDERALRQDRRGRRRDRPVLGQSGHEAGRDGYLNLTDRRPRQRHDRSGRSDAEHHPDVLPAERPGPAGPGGHGRRDAGSARGHGQPPYQPPGLAAGPAVLAGLQRRLAAHRHIDLYSFGTFSSRNTAAWLTFRNPNASNNITAVNPDGYTPKLFLKDRDFQVAAGAKGTDVLGFDWDLSTTFSRDDVDYYENSLNASLGPASPTYFYIGALKFQEWTTNLDLTREVDTGVFAEPLFVAGGRGIPRRQVRDRGGRAGLLHQRRLCRSGRQPAGGRGVRRRLAGRDRLPAVLGRLVLARQHQRLSERRAEADREAGSGPGRTLRALFGLRERQDLQAVQPLRDPVQPGHPRHGQHRLPGAVAAAAALRLVQHHRRDRAAGHDHPALSGATAAAGQSRRHRPGRQAAASGEVDQLLDRARRPAAARG